MPGHVIEEIEKAVPQLLNLAKELTWNKISYNLVFILTEIKNSDKYAFEQRRLTNRENDRKTPVPLHELAPALLQLYDDFYDINLYIYKATKKQTVIDIRYYCKSSLDEDYRVKVIGNNPMMHCKISIPPWRSDNKEKFSINWEHDRWRNFLFKMKVKWRWAH